MIKNDIRLTTISGSLIISESGSALDYFGGAILMGIGSLVLYVFLSGGAPAPVAGKGIIGWLILAVVFISFCVLPFCWGFSVAFRRSRFLIDRDASQLRSLIIFAGIPVRTTIYPLPLRKIIVDNRVISGRFASYPIFVVTGVGDTWRVDIASFEDQMKANSFATGLAAEFPSAGSPVDLCR